MNKKCNSVLITLTVATQWPQFSLHVCASERANEWVSEVLQCVCYLVFVCWFYWLPFAINVCPCVIVLCEDILQSNGQYLNSSFEKQFRLFRLWQEIYTSRENTTGYRGQRGTAATVHTNGHTQWLLAHLASGHLVQHPLCSFYIST